jgi:hypothetical protein
MKLVRLDFGILYPLLIVSIPLVIWYRATPGVLAKLAVDLDLGIE